MRWTCVGLPLLLCACGLRVALHGELDPAYAPTRIDPVALVLPDNSSISDRQVYAAFAAALPKAGFRLVDVKDAKWILGVGTHKDTIFSGIESSGFAIAGPGPFGGATAATFGSAKAEYTSQLTIYCWLYNGNEYRNGKRLAAWGGSEVTTPSEFFDHPDQLIGALIDIYAKNFYDDSERVSKVQGDVKPQ